MKRAAVICLAVLLLPSCWGGGPDVSAYIVTQLEGRAQIRSGEEPAFKALTSGTRVDPGSAIRVLAQSTVTLSRGTDTFIRIRPVDPGERCQAEPVAAREDCFERATQEQATPAEVRVVALDDVVVSTGDALVRSDPSAPVSVRSAGVRATSEEGTFRFDRRLSLRVGVYAGSATVSVAGTQLALPSLRQGVIAGRSLPRAPTLLRYRQTDPWDRELLKDVLDLDEQLRAQREGYEGEFGGHVRNDAAVRRADEPVRASVLRARINAEIRALRTVAPDRDLSFLRPALRERSRGDVMIGLVTALLLEEEQKGEARELFGQVFDLLDQGASWGFVARDNGVVPEELIGAVVRAIGLRTGDVAPGTSVTGPTPAPSVTPTGGSSPAPSPSRSPRPTSSPTSSPKPTKSPSPSPSPSRSPSPSPSPSPTCVQVGPICV